MMEPEPFSAIAAAILESPAKDGGETPKPHTPTLRTDDGEPLSAIAAALQEALSDPTRLETMGRAARRCLETRFRRDVMADSLEALYASVAAGGSVPRGRTGLAGEP